MRLNLSFDVWKNKNQRSDNLSGQMASVCFNLREGGVIGDSHCCNVYINVCGACFHSCVESCIEAVCPLSCATGSKSNGKMVVSRSRFD